MFAWNLKLFVIFQSYNSGLFLFIISLFLSNQGKIFLLIPSRLKIKSYVFLPVLQVLVLYAMSVSSMAIALLMLVSISLTYIKTNNGSQMKSCGTP